MTDINDILAERRKTHGDYAVHASVTQLIKDALASAGSDRLSPVQKESLDMIAHKMGRIVAGDPDHADHWDDIAGYAKLASKELQPKLAPGLDMSRANEAAQAQIRAMSEQAKADLGYLDRHGLPGLRRDGQN